MFSSFNIHHNKTVKYHHLLTFKLKTTKRNLTSLSHVNKIHLSRKLNVKALYHRERAFDESSRDFLSCPQNKRTDCMRKRPFTIADFTQNPVNTLTRDYFVFLFPPADAGKLFEKLFRFSNYAYNR